MLDVWKLVFAIVDKVKLWVRVFYFSNGCPIFLMFAVEGDKQKKKKKKKFVASLIKGLMAFVALRPGKAKVAFIA